MMCLLRELGSVIGVNECGKTMKRAIFQDNNGAFEMGKALKIRPRAKHIAIKRYFCAHTEKGDMLLEKISTTEQQANLTKPLVQQLFC